MAPQAPSAAPHEDVIRILVATDNHLGYMEKDPVRGGDSLDTFEEIMRVAQENEVDMVLLGGDLFHDNKPSRKVLHSTLELLRAYCMSGRPCSLEILSDQSINFPNRFATVNYQDPNLNISLPVFSIHGNHDDPSGDGNLSALDILSAAGLVNYFGKCKEADNIAVSPVLLRKGKTKLALYGLGNVRDERLHRTFVKGNVKMLRPRDNPDSWFNLMVFHQNRVPHGKTNFIPESFLDDFLHLVLWGHEHECQIDPVWNAQQGFHITQPGSSIATSLSDGESRDKHIAILSIYETAFELQKIRLKSVRPFIMDEVVLNIDTHYRPTEMNKVHNFIVDKVEKLIQEAQQTWLTLNDERPSNLELITSNGRSRSLEQSASDVPLPLVRLRIEYSGGFSTFNPQRFGQQFVGRVANPKDVLLFHRRRASHIPGKEKQPKGTASATTLPDLEAVLPERLAQFRVEDLVTEFLNVQNLDLLPENEMNDILRVYVEKHDNDAIQDFVGVSLNRLRITLKQNGSALSGEDIQEQVASDKALRKDAYAQENSQQEFSAAMLRRRANPTHDVNDSISIIDDHSNDSDRPPPRQANQITRSELTRKGPSVKSSGRDPPARTATKNTVQQGKAVTNSKKQKQALEIESEVEQENESVEEEGDSIHEASDLSDHNNNVSISVRAGNKRKTKGTTSAVSTKRQATNARGGVSTQSMLQFATSLPSQTQLPLSGTTKKLLPSTFTSVSSRGRGNKRR